MNEFNKIKKQFKEFIENNNLKLIKEKGTGKYHHIFYTTNFKKSEMRQYNLEKEPKKDIINYNMKMDIHIDDNKNITNLTFQIVNFPIWDRYKINYQSKFYYTLEELESAWKFINT